MTIGAGDDLCAELRFAAPDPDRAAGLSLAVPWLLALRRRRR